MPIQVFSETAPLKTVLLHRPGRELEHLVPGTMGRLLFDDIPYLAGAQEEHDRFAALLRENGVAVKYLTALMAEALAHRPDLRTAFLRTFIQESGPIAKGYENRKAGPSPKAMRIACCNIFWGLGITRP